MIQFHLLGSTVIQKDKQALEQSILAGSKRLALFSYLLLAKPRGYHRRDILISIFWPDLGQKSARNALSNIIYHIRDALGKDIIQNRGSEEIVVNSDKIWCDALAFDEALEKGQYKRALDLYRVMSCRDYTSVIFHQDFRTGWTASVRGFASKRPMPAWHWLKSYCRMANPVMPRNMPCKPWNCCRSPINIKRPLSIC